MSCGLTQRLRARLFIEGVEVPCIAATIQAAPNSPVVASIQIPPLAEGTRFMPLSLMHLFFLDFNEVDSPLLRDANAAVASIESGGVNPTLFERSALRARNKDSSFDQDFIEGTGVPDLKNERYKLVFCGEMVGFAWSKNPLQRSIVLHGQDLSHYWDQAYQFDNTDIFGPGIKALFAGGATNLFTDFLDEPGSVIARIIQTPSTQYPGLKGLLGGIVHLLEAIGGSYYYDKTYAGQNIFFSIAELRLHITQMITAYENDPTCSRLVNAGGYDSLFGRILGGLGSQVSIRNAINALMPVIFHETYGQPSPLYTPGTGGTVSGSVRKKVKDDPTNSFIATTADGLVTALTQIKSDLVSNASTTKADLLTRLNAARRLCAQTSQKIRAKNISSAQSLYGSAQSSLGVAVAKLTAWRPNAPSSITDAITKALDDAIGRLSRAADLEINVTPKKKAIPARLGQQILKPDTWFTAPPRCNVLFPEHVTNVSYERMFLAEPTRLLLKTNDSFFGEDELFDNFYFAPKALGVKSQSNDLQALLANDLLDHELFTGILPVFEKMGELNIFAARSGTVQGKIPKVGLAQRSTNFLYFKHRFSARRLSVSGRFNPYVVVGFPGLIIDKYVDAETLRLHAELVTKAGAPTREINKLLGTHFLGSFTEVTHTIDQRQGRTDINCSYPRQPEEGVEFLGQVQREQPVQKRQPTNALRKTEVAAIGPPRPGSLGPNLGEIKNVTEVTSKYKTNDFQNGPKLPLYQGPRSKKGDLSVKVPIGFATKASDYGPDVVTFVGDPNIFVQFRAFEVSEEVPRYKKELVDLPPEEYIRPGWYGDCWHPAEVSKVYEQFFKTGAITEPIQVSDHTGGAGVVVNSDALSTLSQQQNAGDGSDPRVSEASVFSLINNRSIEDAVAFLVLVYSHIKRGGLDANEFIRNYTWRPIASMIDMFGTSDLQLSADGARVVKGIEGFHSRAFGPYEDLFGLVNPEIETLLNVKRNDLAAQRLDTRRRKQDAVRAYVGQIQIGRALLG